MDLRFTSEQERFRAEVRSWIEANAPSASKGTGPLASLDTAEGFEAHRGWERVMYDARWSVVSWPEEYGGRGVGLLEWLIFEEEYYRAAAPTRVGQNGIFLLAPTLFEFGTAEQKARYLPAMASGEEIWCQGWSEPDAGSDLAAIRSRATHRSGDGGETWVLNGQKTWCSRGAFADWIFGLFRSDPEAERHRGLTYFLVPMDSPGVTVRPIAQLDGETGFAEVFFEDVVVPAAQVLGGVGEGWKVAMATAGSERGLSLRSPARYTEAAARLVELYRRRAAVDPVRAGRHADDVARAVIDAEAYRLQTYWTVTRVLDGGGVGPEASMNKLFWSQTDLAIQSTALALLGEEAEMLIDDARPPQWLDGFLFALAGPIYAGTNEIQRNVVAERVLGLPPVLSRPVHFAFDEEQLEFRAQLRSFAEKECTPADVRDAWSSVLGWSRPRWTSLAEMGVVGITVPEEYGGLGLDLLDAVLLLEEAGRAGLPEPLLETIALGVPVLVDAPGAQGDALRSRWLRAVADGGVTMAMGLSTMPAVPHAEGADLLLLERDGDLHAVPAAAVGLTPRPALDGTRRLAEVEWEPSASTLVVSGFQAEEVLAALGDRAAMSMGAVLVGVADRLIAMASQYAKDRSQFGKPIGSFQAVKHHLADALVRVEFARPMVYRAAWSLSVDDPDASLHASMAKAMASDAATLAARTALQVHGAIGYTWEHDLHLWMKRAWALAAAWGDATTHRARVLETLSARR